MPKPRRAVRRRPNGRMLLSATLIAITAVVTLVIWQLSNTEASVALPGGEESAVLDGTSASTDPSPPYGSDLPSTSAASDPSAAASAVAPKAAAGAANAKAVDWAAAVAGCRQRVQSRDTVIARAATGIEHWHQHVQAQTDADAGRVSLADMKKSFMRTRLQGPADVAGYSSALDAAASQSGSCAAAKGAPADAATVLGQCALRLAAQRPVLAAAADGMDDWSAHLAFMRRNKAHPVDHAQAIWIGQWRAAPQHISAFEQAEAAFGSAPTC